MVKDPRPPVAPARHGLAVPTSEAVYAILQPWAIRNEHASA
jgi:hypothetical protein